MAFLANIQFLSVLVLAASQGHPRTIFGKYLFGGRFEI